MKMKLMTAFGKSIEETEEVEVYVTHLYEVWTHRNVGEALERPNPSQRGYHLQRQPKAQTSNVKLGKNAVSILKELRLEAAEKQTKTFFYRGEEEEECGVVGAWRPCPSLPG